MSTNLAFAFDAANGSWSLGYTSDATSIAAQKYYKQGNDGQTWDLLTATSISTSGVYKVEVWDSAQTVIGEAITNVVLSAPDASAVASAAGDAVVLLMPPTTPGNGVVVGWSTGNDLILGTASQDEFLEIPGEITKNNVDTSVTNKLTITDPNNNNHQYVVEKNGSDWTVTEKTSTTINSVKTLVNVDGLAIGGMDVYLDKQVIAINNSNTAFIVEGTPWNDQHVVTLAAGVVPAASWVPGTGADSGWMVLNATETSSALLKWKPGVSGAPSSLQVLSAGQTTAYTLNGIERLGVEDSNHTLLGVADLTSPSFSYVLEGSGTTNPPPAASATHVTHIWADGTGVIGLGDGTMQFKVQFSNNVTASGTPSLALQVGNQTVSAPLDKSHSYSNTNELIFTLALSAGSPVGPVSVTGLELPTGSTIMSGGQSINPNVGVTGNIADTFIYPVIVDATANVPATGFVGNQIVKVDDVTDITGLVSQASKLAGPRDLLLFSFSGEAADTLSYTFDSVNSSWNILKNGVSTGISFSSAGIKSGTSGPAAVTGFDELAFGIVTGADVHSTLHFSLASRSIHETNTTNALRDLNFAWAGSLGADTIDASTLTTTDGTTQGSVRIDGDWGNDTITGSAGTDYIHGGGGNDSITSAGGDDVIVFSRGSDALNAGDGIDTVMLFREENNADSNADAPPITRVLKQSDGLHVQVLQAGLGFVDAYLVSPSAGSPGAGSITNQAGDSLSYSGLEQINLGSQKTMSLTPTSSATEGWWMGTQGSDSYTLDTLSQVATTVPPHYFYGAGGYDTVTILVGASFSTPYWSVSQNEFMWSSGNASYSFNSIEKLIFDSTDDSKDVTFTALNFRAPYSASLYDGIDASKNPSAESDHIRMADTLAPISNVRQLDGQGGDDVLIGSDKNDGAQNSDDLRGGVGNDVLMGMSGKNHLDGGDGVDEASYELAYTSVTVSLYKTTEQNTGMSSDTLVSIENLRGGDNSDVLSGSGWSNTVNGGGGDDVLRGGRGDDSLVGGSGDDELIGGLGNDVLQGGVGTDVLRGGLGADVFVFLNTDIQSDRSVDQILDFNVLNDKIKIEGAASATLSYDTSSGLVRVDLDGSGSAYQDQAIAQLNPGLILTSNNWLIV